MSTATAFVHPRLFPFCVTDISGSHTGDSYIDNLTADQVVPFAWNLETFTVTLSGSATKGAATVDTAGTICSNPPSATNYDQGLGNGMWVPYTTKKVWANWPAAKAPNKRVCNSVDGQICFFLGELSTNPTTNFFDLTFYVGTDPVNSGKYRIYYYNRIVQTVTSGTDTVQIAYGDPTLIGTTWNSGTYTLGGLTFSWKSRYTTGATPSGTGTMSVSSSNYTY